MLQECNGTITRTKLLKTIEPGLITSCNIWPENGVDLFLKKKRKEESKQLRKISMKKTKKELK